MNVQKTADNLNYSKLSGALGNYRGVSPEVEKEALKILGCKPFYGATQIMPRELYAPIADALCQIVLTLNNIAMAIRLGARSGRPIYQEPFGKKQKGSSAMPHKKNTIATERVEGMARMAKGYCQMIKDNIVTWEERAIEQSSVERVAWPDLFHVAIHAAKTMTRILEGLKVFPDNMLLEIVDSRGCYASGVVKEFLQQHGTSIGFTAEDAYRIVQLAAFNAFEPEVWLKKLRENLCSSFEQADENNKLFYKNKEGKTIYEILLIGNLKVSSQLKASVSDVKRWNGLLASLFTNNDIINQWNQIFKPSHLLRGEKKLYEEILGE